ncbi:MAG: ABC transporter ATP-binding protein [Deltaproteobacteria bacterium]|nr:ABC transporter ATP-binding protein [Deltaproteobacteria bacterium]
MSSFLNVVNLTKNFLDGSGNELKILQGISMNFPKNKTHSIVGSSGSGKSTLLNIIGGLDHPTSGKVFFKEEDIFAFQGNKLANWRNTKVGFVFQAHHLLNDFSALENVMIPGLIKGLSKAECENKAKRLLSQVSLKDRENHKPGQLSGGEQQRVAIARALLNSPEAILADEPTGNLDLDTGKIVIKVLKNVAREQNATLILVTHNPEIAASMEIRLQLDKGHLVAVE